MDFLPRKAKGGWSHLNIKRFQELKKKGLAHRSGLSAFEQRDKAKSIHENPSFSGQQLRKFKDNNKAWAFFCAQTPSYQRYMISWVISAKKVETQEKRLKMLIEDSGAESKLKRVVDALAKIQKKNHKPGHTPIEEARNIGPVCGSELRSLEIDTVEKFKSLGWERTFQRMVEHYPHRFNLNLAMALAAAFEDQDIRKLDPDLKAEAKAIFYDLKRGLR